MDPLEPGVVLAGRYRLERKLGEGGMGVVWAATHVVTRQSVALKLLLAREDKDGHFVKRFMREARAASAVKHPNVVPIYDVLQLDEHTPMMVMEMLDGESLGERLDREQRLPVGEVARVLLPVISALGTAHTLGIVHRDVKPDNIFLAKTPDGVEVKVLDFGIAKLTAQEASSATGTLTATDSLVGTPYYMAPEQIFGEKDIDHRADIWALGVIAYECLAGARPTEADNIGQILKIVTTGRIEPLDRVVPELPRDIVAVVMQALTSDRDARPSLQMLKTTLARYTDVRVRDFGEPAIRTGAPPSSSNLENSKERVALRVSDSARPEAATIASGERARISQTAETLDAGVTRIERRPPSRWSAIAIAVGVLAAGSYATLRILGSRAHASVAPATSTVATHDAPSASSPVAMPSASASATAAPVAQPSASAPRAITTQAISPTPRARPTASAATSVAATASASRPQPSATHTPGGVVESLPY